MSITIRHQEELDIVSIASLFAERSVIDGTMRLPNASLEATRQRLKPAEGMIRLVAVDDELPEGHPEAVIGFAELETYPSVPRHRHAADLHLIAVRESSQGTGLGRRLIAEVLDLADHWLQVTRITLVAWTDNLNAIALYQSVGFEIEGTMPAYTVRSGELIDAHLMGRLTGTAAR